MPNETKSPQFKPYVFSVAAPKLFEGSRFEVAYRAADLPNAVSQLRSMLQAHNAESGATYELLPSIPQTEEQMIAVLTHSILLCRPSNPPPLTVAQQRDCFRGALVAIAAAKHTGPEVTKAINDLLRAAGVEL